MSNVTSLSGLAAKMLLAVAFIDGHVHDKEGELMAALIQDFGDVDIEEQTKIIDGFKGLDAEGVIDNVSNEIAAIAQAEEAFKHLMLMSMSLVALADGETHTNELAFISVCKNAWGI